MWFGYQELKADFDVAIVVVVTVSSSATRVI